MNAIAKFVHQVRDREFDNYLRDMGFQRCGECDGDGVLIELTKGKFAQVDADDYFELSKFRWYATYTGNAWYAARLDRNIGKRLYMHRALMGTPIGMETDHINGNGLDNRRCNLRIVTPQQNRKHRVNRTKRSSIFLGVHRLSRANESTARPWVAQITSNYKTKSLGIFASEIEAAIAYNKAATELHGEYASLNEIGM